MKPIINGIQQVGLGVSNARETFNWYRRAMGFDILVFEDESVARLMLPYTGGVAIERYALLALNMLGGGGMEFWQPRGKYSRPPLQPFQLGDLGINLIKLRSKDLQVSHRTLMASPGSWVGAFPARPQAAFFYAADPWGNYVELVADNYAYTGVSSSTGGVVGAVIGVSDMERSIAFYQFLLGYDVVVSDREGYFDEFAVLPGGHKAFRRVLLEHSSRAVGGFGKLLGPSSIELLQVKDRKPRPLFEGRHWGDLGYIHLCFDIQGMGSLKDTCKRLGYAFTVDSEEGFNMGEASGRFAYIEDPDGTLIEFVETFSVPVIKKLNLSINLKHRNPLKPLPKWLVKFMEFQRVYRDL